MSEEGVVVERGGPAVEDGSHQRLIRYLELYLPREVLNRLPPEYRVWLYGQLRGPVTALVIWGRSWIPIPDSLLERLGGVERVLGILQRLPEEVQRVLRQRVVNATY